jgi:branched-chain amino acid transport system substrate-binding protein
MTRARRWIVFGALALVLGLTVAACGGDDEAAAPPAEPAPAEPAEPAEPPAEPAEPAETAEAPAETSEPAAEGEPIVIGAAIDLTGQMAPFDGPALAAAQYEVDQINAAGGVDGRPLEFIFQDTELDPEQTKAAAIDLIENQGAEVLIVTCDVEFAAPATQEAINRGVLAVSPCIGTDQQGPKRFGDAGKLAFSLGNVAQDEGAAMAEWALSQGWQTAAIAKDNVIFYFQNVVDAFAARFEEQGGTIATTEEWTNGDGTVGNVAGALAEQDVDVIVTSTAFGDLPALVDGIRSLGNETPILCSWSCDGTYWNPPNLSNFYLVAYASVAGDDPSEDVLALQEALAAQDPALLTTGSAVTGAAAIDAIVEGIEQTGGTDGAALADAFEGFSGVPTISGDVSFSPELHSVFGREYRVMEIQDGELRFIELFAASSPATLPG